MAGGRKEKPPRRANFSQLFLPLFEPKNVFQIENSNVLQWKHTEEGDGFNSTGMQTSSSVMPGTCLCQHDEILGRCVQYTQTHLLERAVGMHCQKRMHQNRNENVIHGRGSGGRNPLLYCNVLRHTSLDQPLQKQHSATSFGWLVGLYASHNVGRYRRGED